MAAVGALVLGAASFALQAKSARAQEKAMKAQQKAQELADARARRQLLRSSAIARGETVNLGANLGAMESSSLIGGLSGLTNQQQAQLGFQQTTLDISKYITGQNISSSRYLTMASLFDTAGSLFKGMPGSTVGPRSPYPSLSGLISTSAAGYGNQAARAGY